MSIGQHSTQHSTQQPTPVALVTGGTQRIGLAIVNQLHALGYRVFIHYHSNSQAALELARKLNTTRPDSALAMAANLARPEELQHLALAACQQWQRLDVLVNNAALFEPDLATAQLAQTLGQWQNLLDLNLKAAFLLAQFCAAALCDSSGSIINLVDIYAERPLKSHTIYSISKAGSAMLTKSLALEMAPRVRVNGIAPGAILWPNNPHGDETDQRQQHLLSKVPLGRLGSVQAIAETVSFLLRCDYITGQIIKVDGGRSITI